MKVCFRTGSAGMGLASRRTVTALALFVLAACPFASSARADDYMTETPVPKKALVIGVSDYKHLPKLPVSKLDSNRFRARVESFNFIVTQASATDRSSLIKAVQSFADTLNGGDIALVYYSGHGFQRSEFNYLVPSDAPACSGNVVLEDIPVTYISEQLEKRGVAAYLLVLDACRNTPQDCRPVVAGRLRGVQPVAPVPPAGLAAPAAPLDHEVIYASWMIALAASPGRPAWSGSDGSNGSIYSRHLTELFGTRGWDLTKTFDGVRRKVREDSGGQQIPSEQRVMYGDIFIDPDDVMRRNYKQAWQQTLSLNDTEAVKYYLLSFPESPYAAMARKWLKDNAGPAAPSPGMVLSSADQPAVLASAGPSEPETRSRGFSLRDAARERRRAGAARPSGHGSEREAALQRKFFTLADRLTQSQQFDSLKAKARSEEERKLKVAERTKTKVLTLEPQPAPEAAGSWVAIEVNAIDGVPVSESLKGKGSGTSDQPASVPLKELFPDKEHGKAAADTTLEQFGELKGAKVEVELSDAAPDAPTQGHARMQAFRRSLQIRKDLLDSGVESSKIVVKMPEKFQLEGNAPNSVATRDQLTIIKPDK